MEYCGRETELDWLFYNTDSESSDSIWHIHVCACEDYIWMNILELV